MRVLEMELAGLPMLRRDTKHWRVRHQETQHWRTMVRGHLEAAWLGRELGQARLTLTRYSARCPDADNLAVSFKPVVDALVHWKVLADDNPDIIGTPEYRWEKAPRGEGRIRVVVEARLQKPLESQP